MKSIRIPILNPGRQESFPPLRTALDDPNGLLAAGGDLSPARLLDAYRHGIFPWFSHGEPILWWSPDPRMVFATDQVHISTKLQRWLRRCAWTVRADTAFAEVMTACAQPRPTQPTTWISEEMIAAYTTLHRLGAAHSIEIFDGDALVGGIYGVAVGRMFYGESMFSARDNGSKVALLALCRQLHEWDFPLLDAQVTSSHLVTMGAFEMPRERFAEIIQRQTAHSGIDGNWTEKLSRTQARELL